MQMYKSKTVKKYNVICRWLLLVILVNILSSIFLVLYFYCKDNRIAIYVLQCVWYTVKKNEQYSFMKWMKKEFLVSLLWPLTSFRSNSPSVQTSLQTPCLQTPHPWRRHPPWIFPKMGSSLPPGIALPTFEELESSEKTIVSHSELGSASLPWAQEALALSRFWFYPLLCLSSFHIYRSVLKNQKGGIPWCPSGWDSTLPLRGVRVPSWVGGQRSHMLRGESNSEVKLFSRVDS